MTEAFKYYSEDLHCIGDSSRLGNDRKKLLYKMLERRLPYFTDAVETIIRLDPAFHFTPESFRYTPRYLQDELDLRKQAEGNYWDVETQVEDGSLVVSTNNLRNILSTGLNENSCVGKMSPDDSQAIMSAHPKTFLTGIRNIVLRFSKHGIPYKYEYT